MKNKSIFEGILTATAPGGKKIRAISRGAGVADVYVQCGNAYVMQATVMAEFTPDAVCAAFERICELEEVEILR